MHVANLKSSLPREARVSNGKLAWTERRLYTRKPADPTPLSGAAARKDSSPLRSMHAYDVTEIVALGENSET